MKRKPTRKPMNCPHCRRPLATEEDYEAIPEGEGGHLCWNAWGDDQCKAIERELKESAMTTIEIIKAAIAQGCEIGIYTTTPNGETLINVDIEGPETFGCNQSQSLETAVANAWRHYQTNQAQ